MNEHAVALRFLNDIARDLSQREVSFPTFDRATLHVRQALDQPDLDTESVARVLAREPLVAARLVKLANSVAENPGGRPVSDIRTAVVRLGRVKVRAVAVAVSLQQLRADPELRRHAARAGAAWQHTVRVAAVAYALARRAMRINPDEALFAGLVHDIGYFYLLAKSGLYPELDADPAALDAILAEWHGPIGQSVLHTLVPSEAVIEAVAEHESARPPATPRTLRDAIAIANAWCHDSNPVRVAAPPALDPAIVALIDEEAQAIAAVVASLQD